MGNLSGLHAVILLLSKSHPSPERHVTTFVSAHQLQRPFFYAVCYLDTSVGLNNVSMVITGQAAVWSHLSFKSSKMSMSRCVGMLAAQCKLLLATSNRRRVDRVQVYELMHDISMPEASWQSPSKFMN